MNKPYLLEFDECKVDLSIVVPCYNESKRFPRTFDETYSFISKLKKERNITVEMVLVNDGSRDATWEMIKKYCADYENDKVLKVRGVDVSKNSGKGNACRMGFLYSKGDNLLIIDADGATDIADYQRLQTRVVLLHERSWMKSPEKAKTVLPSAPEDSKRRIQIQR
eukprot:TRINITY_DN1373_c0_g1_i4.p2 TRINITY_DN1373_c0_g1~~TRINITY_DN1373_c0_g1_i4.p2  ORF type:complete len:166 (+),score=49.77 TRINITY_DN1373_c0_g1_i4:366-863(+)